jgi:hypothetical protein
VNFRTKTMKAGVPPPEYLLFLKRRGDGRYEPVSGRVELGRGMNGLGHS